MNNLLNPVEFEQAKETRFVDGGEKYDEYQRRTREKVIVLAGLSKQYQREPTVHACFAFYLSGQYTLQGSLLMAYRALSANNEHLVKLLKDDYKIECPPMVLAPQTLESVAPGHVVSAASRCEVLRGILSDALAHESPKQMARRMGLET